MKVIGIGDNVVDRYIHLNKMFPGGNALNFSVYAKKLGVNAAYMGVLGNDSAARHITKTLKKLDIEISHCQFHKGENAYAEVNIVDGERIFTGTNKGGIANKYPLEFTEDNLNYINNYNLIHTSCYSDIEDKLYRLNNLNIPISFDFSKNIDDDYLKKVCPQITFSFFSCAHLSDNKTEEILKRSIKYGSKLALATKGKEGAVLMYKEDLYYQESKDIEPIDTLGAGDAFITAFLIENLKEGFKFSQEVIRKGLKAGAENAARFCGVYGAFGNGKEIN